MPELPDIEVYLNALRERLADTPLQAIRLGNPFLLRTVRPAPSDLIGKRIIAFRRLGKRVALGLDDDLWIVIHLMIAGRLHWAKPGAALPGKRGLAAIDTPSGSLLITEAGTKKRASLHLVAGSQGMAEHLPVGLEPLECGEVAFAARLTERNHTVKRALTDQRLFLGIGNAYSDEILHAARISPIKMTQKLTDEEIATLHSATVATLVHWTNALDADRKGGFPEKVTAFRPEMAVHGKFGEACPVCAAPVQRIVHASNETNYCAGCQTDGKILADRYLSTILKKDWPKALDDLEGKQP